MEKKLQRKIIILANNSLGKKYKYGAKLKEAPHFFDCSGFIVYIFRQIGADLPRRAIQQAELGKKINHKVQNLVTGDLIFTRGRKGRYNPNFPKGIGHVYIYLKDGKVVSARWFGEKHSRHPGGMVMIENLDKIKQKDHISVIKRLS